MKQTKDYQQGYVDGLAAAKAQMNEAVDIKINNARVSAKAEDITEVNDDSTK